MSINRLTTLLSMFAIAAVCLALAGCGSDKPELGESDTGATAGASGEAAGGFAPEAGKQRSAKDKAEQAAHFSKEPPPIQIQSGNVSGYKVDKPSVVVIQSTNQMRAMRKKVYAGQPKTPSNTWAPTDFKTRQFVFVALPKQPKGSLVAITDIYQNGTTMIVKATELLRGKGCKAPGQKPNPWQVVETRKMTGVTPVLKLTRQQSSPC